MNSENSTIALWFAELFQFIATIILTPEIIGPDRFEKLEKLLESKDFSKKEPIIWFLVFITGLGLTCPYIIQEASARRALMNGVPWNPPFGREMVFIIIAVDILGLILLALQSYFTRFVQSALVKFVAYLRRVSVFRTVSIIVAVSLFFLGTGLKLVLQWPFW